MLKLQPEPTFTAKVEIPTPWGPQHIKVEYKYLDADQYDAFVKREAEENRANADVVLDLAVGWKEVEGEFSEENVRALCKTYLAAGKAIIDTFIRENTQARVENFGR